MVRTQLKRFKVRGRAPFPIDMLRYDQCYPDTEADSGRIENLHYKLDGYLIGLAGRRVTPERWASFGWTVIKD